MRSGLLQSRIKNYETLIEFGNLHMLDLTLDSSASAIPFPSPALLSTEQSEILAKNPLKWSGDEVVNIQLLFIQLKNSLKGTPYLESNEYYYALCVAALLTSRIEYFVYKEGSANKPPSLSEENTFFKEEINPFIADWQESVEPQLIARKESKQQHSQQPQAKPNMWYVAFLSGLNLLGATLLGLGIANIWNPFGWVVLGITAAALMIGSVGALSLEMQGKVSLPAFLGLFIPLLNFFIVKHSVDKMAEQIQPPKIKQNSHEAVTASKATPPGGSTSAVSLHMPLGINPTSSSRASGDPLPTHENSSLSSSHQNPAPAVDSSTPLSEAKSDNSAPQPRAPDSSPRQPS